MKIEVDKPANCPFLDTDRDCCETYCQIEQKQTIECNSSIQFPDNCPLRNGSVEVSLKSE